jgi:hypothetical protein
MPSCRHGHHAGIGGAVQLDQLVLVMVNGQQVHRLVARAAEALVDAVGQCMDAVLEGLVLFQRAA